MRRLSPCGLFVLLTVSLGTGGCGGPYPLTCEDLAPPNEATFERVQALVVRPGASTCSRCHNTATPVKNLNFEGPGVAYDALTSKPAIVYEQVASGRMPEGGPAWSPEQLRVLRTWYCRGAPYVE